jgi:hypothetical protein
MPERVKKTLKYVSEKATMHDVIKDEDDEYGETVEREDRWVRTEPR